MKNRNRLKYLWFAVPLIACGLCVSFLMIADPVLLRDIQYDIIYGGRSQHDPFDDPPGDFEYYRINPSTILADLKSGKNDVFDQLKKEPDSFKDIYTSGTFAWSQEDYLTVAKAHHLYLTGESVDSDWKIYGSGDFGIYPCRDAMKGFDTAKVIFYKEAPDSFPVTYMYVYPLKGLIYSANISYRRENRPLMKIFDDINDHFYEAEALKGRITADDALNIAEGVEGKAMRRKLSNDGCDVWVNFSGDEYWSVRYSWSTDDLRFRLDFAINTNDGSYKVSRKVYKCERAICP